MQSPEMHQSGAKRLVIDAPAGFEDGKTRLKFPKRYMVEAAGVVLFHSL
jgi:hypothetical protein